METTKFDKLIALIEPLKDGEYGSWVVDKEKKGTKDEPIHFSSPKYSDVVQELMKQVYSLHDNNPEFELTRYNELLEERGIEWSSESLEHADVSSFDAQGILAMLMAIVRAERFCDGAVMSACKSGAIVRWLERLKDICAEN